MYVCMYIIGMYVCYVCMYVCMYLCIYTYECVYECLLFNISEYLYISFNLSSYYIGLLITSSQLDAYIYSLH